MYLKKHVFIVPNQKFNYFVISCPHSKYVKARIFCRTRGLLRCSRVEFCTIAVLYERALWCPPVTCDLCRFGSSSSVWPSSSSLSARCNSRNSRKPSDRKSKKSQLFVALLVVFCRLVSWPCHRAILRSAGVFRGFYISVWCYTSFLNSLLPA